MTDSLSVSRDRPHMLPPARQRLRKLALGKIPRILHSRHATTVPSIGLCLGQRARMNPFQLRCSYPLVS